MSQSQVPKIILYHYTFSPYAKRIVWYLNLRQIPYAQCLQPPTLPRPDITALGTSYRRIPLLSIGRDIYNDTRLILQKLSLLFPPSTSHPSISPSTNPNQQALEKLLEIWAVDGGLFKYAASLLPSSLPLLRDEKFRKDREDYTGTSWDPANMERGRSEALVEIRGAFEVFEYTFFTDERRWVAGGGDEEGPTLADIEAVWPFHWLKSLPGALPQEYISQKQFPRVWDWVERFDTVVKGKGKQMGRPKTVDGKEARDIVRVCEWAEKEGVVEVSDPSGLRKGQMVEVWPTDSGFNHKDKGVLVALTGREVVIESQMEDGTEVRVHAPRHGFRVRALRNKDGGPNL